MNGLTSAQAEKALKEHGKNRLTAKTANPWYKILFSQFTDLLVIILILAAVVSFFLSHDPVDSYVIFGIVLLNAGIGFFQEYRTEKTLEALKKMVHPEIRVFRDGQEVLLPTELLVPGDWVILGEGDKIPADGVLIEAHSLKIEESALTGESVPLDKKTDHEVFMGTSVARGSGTFEVTKTGMNTQFGEIARLTTETEKTKSPLQIELTRIGVFVTKVTGVICVILFMVGLWRDYTLVESLLFSVSVAIAAVPEGLPTTITIALALGASVLARKKAIIKKLSSVETLGAVTTICSDKTGTLTKNEMTVRQVYLPDRSVFEVTGVGYDPKAGNLTYVGGKEGDKGNQDLLKKVLKICQHCNEAKLQKHEGVYRILGDPTEGALLTLAAKADHSILEKTPSVNLPTDEIFPFDSDRKMMSVIVKGEKSATLMAKGSPDQVLEKCTHWTDGEELYPLDKDKRAKIQAHYERMAENALRVLAFAQKELPAETKAWPKNDQEAEEKLVFMGLAGMIDPPRDEVKDAIATCRGAGIRVIVITGDYGVTAAAIAKELGIVRGEAKVYTGAEVETMSDEELGKILKQRDQSVIFARSLPAQKMRVVKLLQDQDEVVAMTGDGVNDAPALKKADIGVAMGITGTEVSKEAATMILTNDSFASIVTAVEEGRRIYENLRKFVWFIFSCNIAELIVIFAAILFAFPLPLTAILILCIDLGTDILPAIALGVDNAEKNLMQRPPRDTKKKVMEADFVYHFLATGLIIGALVSIAFLFTIMRDGWAFGQPINGDWDHATTVAFVCLVCVQLVNAFTARSFTQSLFTNNPLKNPFMIMAVFTSLLMVLVMVYVPWMNTLLNTSPLSLQDWEVVAAVSFVPLAFIEFQKWLLRRRRKLAV